MDKVFNKFLQDNSWIKELPVDIALTIYHIYLTCSKSAFEKALSDAKIIYEINKN